MSFRVQKEERLSADSVRAETEFSACVLIVSNQEVRVLKEQ